jgi:hypothetical protein
VGSSRRAHGHPPADAGDSPGPWQTPRVSGGVGSSRGVGSHPGGARSPTPPANSR